MNDYYNNHCQHQSLTYLTGGDYYAKWHKIDGIWKLRSEVYTQLDCRGDVVCNNKPTL